MWKSPASSRFRPPTICLPTSRDAAAALAQRRLVILPTETVYGLAADAADPAAVAAIFEAKGRPRFNPLIAHVTDLETAGRIAALDDRALALAEAFWPGPLTLVLPLREGAEISHASGSGTGRAAAGSPSRGRSIARSISTAASARWGAGESHQAARPSAASQNRPA